MYVVIVGGGKVGQYLASVLLKGGNEVAVIEQDKREAARLSVEFEGNYMVIAGDGCDSRFQIDAGAQHADAFVAATGQDDANLVACEIAMRILKVPRCIARVNNPKNNRIFRELGIESVSATEIIANMIEEEALMGSMSVVSSLTHDNVTLAEVGVPRLNEHGLRLSEIHLPQGALIAAVSTKKGVEVASRDLVLHGGDKVIVVADVEVMDKVRAIFRNL